MQIEHPDIMLLGRVDFLWVFLFLIAGIMLGYLSMRAVLKRLIDLTHANRRALENLISPQKMKELGEEKNEITKIR